MLLLLYYPPMQSNTGICWQWKKVLRRRRVRKYLDGIRKVALNFLLPVHELSHCHIAGRQSPLGKGSSCCLLLAVDPSGFFQPCLHATAFCPAKVRDHIAVLLCMRSASGVEGNTMKVDMPYHSVVTALD